MLNIKTDYINNILFVKLKGILTKDTIYKLNKKVTNIVKEEKINNVIFNLTNLKYIDIKGINILFYNYELCKNNNGNAFICGNNENIRRKLKNNRLINYVHEIPIELMVI